MRVRSAPDMGEPERIGWISRIRERGVLRVAASYAVIAWLTIRSLEKLGLAWNVRLPTMSQRERRRLA